MAYVIAGIVVLLMAGLAWKPAVTHWRKRDLEFALKDFKLRREFLEAKFFDLASRSGKPRGLVWERCDWHPPVTFARDLETKLLTAFVSLDIYFSALEGGDMEDVEAVGDVRNGSAVFHYARRTWGTGGKVLFNMNPTEVVTRLEGQFTPVTAPGR